MDPLQQIGKELGIPLGHDIPTEALEWIRKTQAELSRLRSAPVAVEVPGLSFWKHSNGKWFCWDGYTNVEMTPSRILKDGERAVPVEEWERLKRNHIRRMIDSREEAETRAWITFRASDRNLELGAASPRSHEIGNRLDRFVARCIDALRSGEAEGRMG